MGSYLFRAGVYNGRPMTAKEQRFENLVNEDQASWDQFSELREWRRRRDLEEKAISLYIEYGGNMAWFTHRQWNIDQSETEFQCQKRKYKIEGPQNPWNSRKELQAWNSEIQSRPAREAAEREREQQRLLAGQVRERARELARLRAEEAEERARKQEDAAELKKEETRRKFREQFGACLKMPRTPPSSHHSSPEPSSHHSPPSHSSHHSSSPLSKSPRDPFLDLFEPLEPD